jgi:hypothetical protein
MARNEEEDLEDVDDDLADDDEETAEEDIDNTDMSPEINADDFSGLYDDQNVLEKHAELLRTLTNFSPYLQKKFYEWSSTYWDETKQKLVPQEDNRPLMNVSGARNFCSFLNTYVRDNNIITVLDEKNFNFMIINILRVCGGVIADNYREFEIRSASDYERIVSELEDSAVLILSGTAGGKYNTFLSGTYRSGFAASEGDARAAIPNIPRQSGGFVNKMKNFLGKNVG